MSDNTTDNCFGNWIILEAKADHQCALYRLRCDQPAKAAELHTLVTVEWEYADQDDSGFPSSAILQSMESFEEAIITLTGGNGFSELVLVFTGMGLKEWSFYTTDWDSFIREFNKSMTDQPMLPIKITYSEDPEWRYWHKFRKYAD
jgi:hypothetical protein